MTKVPWTAMRESAVRGSIVNNTIKCVIDLL